MAATLMLTSFGYFLSISSWIPLIYFSRVICGSFKHTQTLCKAYIADLKSINESKVPKNSKSAKEKSGDNFGIFMAISTCGFVLGPVAGGHLAERPNGFQVVAVSTALTFFTNAIIIQMLLPKLHRRKKDGQSHIATPRAAYGDTVKDNWDIFLLQFLVSLSIMVVRTNYVGVFDGTISKNVCPRSSVLYSDASAINGGSPCSFHLANLGKHRRIRCGSVDGSCLRSQSVLRSYILREVM